MLNHQKIVARIEAVREKEGLSAAAFAQRIGVPRSSLSHLVSGRNKPSLDLLVKIVDLFPEVSLDALVFGKASPNPEPPPPQIEIPREETSQPAQAALPFHTPTPTTENTSKTKNTASKNAIRHIVLLTEDGEFETYSPKS